MIRSAFIVVLSVLFATAAAQAGNSNSVDLPTASSRTSDYEIRYDDLDVLLSSAVMKSGRSDRRPATRVGNRHTATKIRHGNMAATAFEANRVLFHEFKQAHIDHLRAIRKDLEEVPNFVPFRALTKNEQLAYWLNLHNVAVLIEVAEAYPVKNLKTLQRGDGAVWHEKTMTVWGVPTSIHDIEQHIVTNWNDPLVLYGMFMGTIGGPSIRNHAFTGDNVRRALLDNAIDFVNSLRGFRLWDGDGRVSDHYAIGARYFPNFEEDIRKHILSYAGKSVRADVAKVGAFQIDNYDWGIADLNSGSTYKGSSFNTSSAGLAWFIQDRPSSSSGGGRPPASINDSFVNDPVFNEANIGAKISPQAKALLRAMRARNIRRAANGKVTIEEFIDDERGRVVKKKSSANDA